MAKNETAMTHLIEKILRMPESNIKGFLNISGPAYIEVEKEQIKHAYFADFDPSISIIDNEDAEAFYNTHYNKEDNG
jgi:hypothetical protein